MTPTDADTRINCGPSLFDVSSGDIAEVKISVSWTYDLARARELADLWQDIAPVSIGGIATGQREGDFVPGVFVKEGAVITSRGCNNHCWFCSVWRVNGAIRELPICDGYNVLDSNLLACSEQHVRAVFAMLKRQTQRALFTGGLEAKILKPFVAELLTDLKPKRIFFAYDTPDDREPFIAAMRLLDEYGVAKTSRFCYALCGYKGDTFDAAENRMREIWEFGATPFAMLYRHDDGHVAEDWKPFQRQFSRPAISQSILKGKSDLRLRKEAARC